MASEQSVVYSNIINSVISSLEEENDLDYETIVELKEEWRGNLHKLLSASEDNHSIYDTDILNKESDVSSDNDEYSNYFMCLYEKVTKTKNKWKCQFKKGFINIGNLDFPFYSASGDLEW